MKRLLILSLLLVLGFSLYANGKKEKVLLFIRHGTSRDIDYMVEKEIGVMIQMLEKEGFKVVIATNSGEPIKNLLGQTILLKPDLKLADITVDDYVGIIMPCMAMGSSSWKADPEEITLAKEVAAKGVPIAAQRGAIVILGQAGVLEGKKYPLDYVRFSGAIYSGPGVIRDGNIITSSHCPYQAKMYSFDDGTPELTKLFIEAIAE